MLNFGLKRRHNRRRQDPTNSVSAIVESLEPRLVLSAVSGSAVADINFIVDSQSNAHLQWSPVAGAAAYQLHVYSLTAGKQLLNQTGITGTSFEPNSAFAPDRYQAFVRAFGQDGVPGGWGSPLEFTVLGAPASPSFVTSGSEVYGELPRLNWSPVTGASGYKLQVYSVTAGRLFLEQSPIASASYQSTSVFPPDRYQAFVKTIAPNGVTSAWGNPLEFNVTSAPARPEFITPGVDGYDRFPRLSWTTVAGASSYDLLVYSRTAGRLIMGQTNVTSTSFYSRSNFSPDRYQAFVRAIGQDAIPGPWTSPLEFTVAQQPTQRPERATSIDPEWFESVQSNTSPGNTKSTDPETEWIVQLDASTGANTVSLAKTLLKNNDVDFEVIRGLGSVGLVLARAPESQASAVSAWLIEHHSVQSFSVNEQFVLTETPNDPLLDELFGLHNVGQTGGKTDADIDAVEAWDTTTGSSDIVVAVIDTGVDYTHPDLAANIWTNPGEIAGDGIDNDGNGFVDDVHGYDFVNEDADPQDDNRHGTHVSGTIGAVGNNGVGVVGVNWSTSIMAVKAFTAGGRGTYANIIRATNYVTMMATQFHVDVRAINASFGGNSRSEGMYEAIRSAGEADILFVAAAGNDGRRPAGYPARFDLDNIISVAATDDRDRIASFSSYGAVSVDLAAPGHQVLSTLPEGKYGELSGTSMATPHVVGVVALAWSGFPDATKEQIRNAVFRGVDPLPSESRETVTNGRLNANNTLRILSQSVNLPRNPRRVDASDDLYVDRVLVTWDSVPGATDYDVYRGTSPAEGTIIGSGVTATSMIDHDVVPGVDYYYRVRARNSFGLSVPSSHDIGRAATTPEAPRRVRASRDEFLDKIQLTWEAVSNATTYEVWRGASSRTDEMTRIAAGVVEAAFEDTTAEPGVTYNFRVKAMNIAGESEFSRHASGRRTTLAPKPPRSVNASDESHTDKIRVTWRASDRADEYEIWRGTSSGAGSMSRIAADVRGTTFDDTSATPGVRYYYRVKAVNSHGISDFSSSNRGERKSLAPEAPTLVRASDATYNDKIQVTWRAADGAESYEIWRGTGSSQSSMSRIAANVRGTTFNDRSATPGVRFYYRLKSANSHGVSDFSGSNRGERKSLAPKAPSSVRASDATYSDKVRVTWRASDGAVSYEIWRGTSSNAGAMSRIAGNIRGTTFDDRSATHGVQYYYRVKAAIGRAVSGFSGSNRGERKSLVPKAPGSVRASDATYSDKIRVTWRASDGAASYEIWRGSSSNKNSMSRIAANIRGTSFDDRSATPGVRYYYRLRAVNSHGVGDFSGSNRGERKSLAPKAPQSVRASDATYTDRIRVTWRASDGALRYEVWRGTSSNQETMSRVANVPGLAFNDRSATPGVPYYYRLRAVNNYGVSGFSGSNRGERRS